MSDSSDSPRAEGAPARAEALYSGDVQGVGFRYTARRIAAGHSVSGYVRNRPDGRVEVVAEGPRGEVEVFLREVASEFAGLVSDTKVSWAAATNEFSGFSVRF